MAIAGGHGKRLVQWPPKAWFIRKKSYDRYWLDPSKKLSSKEAAAKLKNTPLHFRVKLFTQEESTTKVLNCFENISEEYITQPCPRLQE